MQRAVESTSNACRPSARRTATVTVAGETIELLPERAAFWPARATLIVADLHIGKEATFRAAGIPLPSTILDETLARLDWLVRHHRIERIVVVGDLVHARRGMSADVVERVAAWRSALAATVELSVGNHDSRVPLPASWRIVGRAARVPDPPFAYCHDPADAPQSGPFAWCGHLHPTVRLSPAGRGSAIPCFAIAGRIGILPAFTAFARGVAMDPEAARLYAIADGEVIPVARDG